MVIYSEVQDRECPQHDPELGVADLAVSVLVHDADHLLNLLRGNLAWKSVLLWQHLTLPPLFLKEKTFCKIIVYQLVYNIFCF